MAPVTKAELERMAKTLETLEVVFEDTMTELKDALDEVPIDRLKVKARIKIFDHEAIEYLKKKQKYNDDYGTINGLDDEQKERIRCTARLARESTELIMVARQTIGLEDDEGLSSMHTADDKAVSGTVSTANRRKLPELNPPKFSGEVRDWLAFWSQFQEIDKDPSLPNINKFQYLIQAMPADSLPQRIVKSYPISSDNYKLALESLKDRYNREGVLVKVYVRDLVKLIISNENNETVDFTNLYVHLSSQLRALGSLGVTTDKSASIILPLVECCLPSETLRAWQRDSAHGTAKTCEQELEQLMEFMKKEVRSEENIRLASGGLSVDKSVVLKPRTFPKKIQNVPPTAAGLLAYKTEQDNKICIFCGFKHSSTECRKSLRMTIEEKKSILREKNRCFVCLREGHPAKKCRCSVHCKSCGGRHETVMCANRSSNQHEKKNGDSSEQEDKKRGSTVSLELKNYSKQEKKVFLKTLTVYLHGKTGSKKVRLILDGGSHKSYVLREIAKSQKLPALGKEEVIHSLFGGLETAPQEHSRYEITLSDLADKYTCSFCVSDSTKISGNIACYQEGPWTEELRRLGINLSDENAKSGPVDILLGADVLGHILTGRNIRLNSGPLAVETKLGWALLGETETIGKPKNAKSLNFSEQNNQTVTTIMLNPEVVQTMTHLHVADDSVDKLWRLDSLGIMDSTDRISKDEQTAQALLDFNSTAKFNQEGRVEVHLPWIPGHRPLPSNRWVAERKLHHTSNKLFQDGKLNDYHAVFNLWEESGIIEEVPSDELNKPAHYLQHRAVYNPSSKTTPIRPVFNASYKKKGEPSLNDCLEKGPNLLELIPVILTRFRLDRVGILADITKAFQQISVAEEDRDSSRFLWWTDLSRSQVKTYRHRRVVFGMNASPFLLAATLKYILEQVSEEKKGIATTIQKSMYVDNLVTTASSLEDAKRIQSEACDLLSTAKMELRGWEIGPTSEENVTGLLGMNWNMKEDTILLDISDENGKLEEPITRRKILSATNAVFDPLGFVTPFMLNFKRLVQETWTQEEKKIGWDTPVSQESKRKFELLYKQLPELKEVRIPRWVTRTYANRGDWSLHVFVDGSKIAYAAAVFLRIQGIMETSVHLLQARSRVTPLKQLTIPRTELLSCMIGARLAAFTKECLEFLDIPTTFWTDSSTALHWIKTDGDWGVFVRNRVKGILDDSRKEDWRHIAGLYNPADLPSRGCSVRKLIESRWWEGPEWLKKPEGQWPTSEVNANLDYVNAERKKMVATCLNHSNQDKELYGKLCKLSQYDQMVRLVEEEYGLPNAEVKLLQMVQMAHFSGTKDQRLKKCEVIQDEELMKIKTRLFYGRFNEKFRCPILLPPESPVVTALIMKTHLENNHGGIQFLMSKLRESIGFSKAAKQLDQR